MNGGNLQRFLGCFSLSSKCVPSKIQDMILFQSIDVDGGAVSSLQIPGSPNLWLVAQGDRQIDDQ